MELVIIVILLVLVIVVLTAGAVTLARRDRPRPVPRSTGRTPTVSGPTRPGEVATEDAAGATATDELVAPEADEALDLDAELEQLLEAPPLVKPSFRDRLGKARGLLAGY